MEVPNETVLQQNLKEQGLFLIQAKNLAEAKDYRKLKTPQLASFCREFSTLLESGITLVRALDIISQQEGLTGYEREIYQAVLLDVKKGITLSEAMETKKCFPELMIGMIRSGEGTGNLDQVTRRLAMQFEKKQPFKPSGSFSDDVSDGSSGDVCGGCHSDRDIHPATVPVTV